MIALKPRHLLVLASLGGALAPALVAGRPVGPVGPDRVRTVALSQTAAPGTIDASFATFAAPVLNNDAEVAFIAALSGPGVTPNVNSAGIWSEGAGPLSLVVRLRDAAPGAAPGYFSGFMGNLRAIADDGRVGFQATLNEPGGITTNRDEGYWRQSDGGLYLVAREGDPAPGVAGAFFASIFTPVDSNEEGRVAFKGTITGSGIGGNNEGLWGSDRSGLQLIARATQPAPGAGSAVFSSFAQPELNDAGEVAFRATLSGSNFVANAGIWQGQSGNLELIVRKGDVAPATEGLRFAGLDPPTLNNAGHSAFRADIFESELGSTTEGGIWKKTTGPLALVAREGDAAPGAAGATFRRPQAPVLNDAGATAFVSQLTGPGVINSLNEEGLWSEGRGSLALVARKGDAAPGAGGGVFGGFDAPALNRRGQTAFLASLYGPGVDAANDAAIWAEDLSGVLRLVVREGDPLDVSDNPSASDLRTVESVTFGGLNDFGQVAFQVRFVDGSQGVFVSSVATVPEPGSLLLLGTAAIAALAGRRLHRRGYAGSRLVE